MVFTFTRSSKHQSSELARTVKTEKDAQHLRTKLAHPPSRPDTPEGELRADAFEKARLQFLAQNEARKKMAERRESLSMSRSPTPEHKHHSSHRISKHEAKQFREFQYSSGMLQRADQQHEVVTPNPVLDVFTEMVGVRVRQPIAHERKPALVKSVVEEPMVAEIVDVEPEHSDVTPSTTSNSKKRESYQSAVSDSSSDSSDTTLVDHEAPPSEKEESRKRPYKYADESTWRTASVIMRSYAKHNPLPNRNVDWSVVPEARRPKMSGLRRSSAQRVHNHMRRTNSRSSTTRNN